MGKVTDPALLAELNRKPVSDPAILATLNDPGEGVVEEKSRNFASGVWRGMAAFGDIGSLAYNALGAASNAAADRTAYKRIGVQPTRQPMIGRTSDALRSIGIDLDRKRDLAGVTGEFLSVPGAMGQKFGVEALTALTAAAGARTGALAFPDSPAAEVVGAMSPFGLQPALSALTRGAFRGVDPTKMNARLADMAATGVKPTVGSATGSRGPQAIEAVVAALPGGHGVIKSVGMEGNAALKESVESLAGGLNRDTVVAGNTLKSGLFGENGWVNSRFRANRNKLYSALDAKVGGATVPGQSTYSFLLSANKGVPGAPQLSSNHFIDKELQGIADDFLSDVTTNNGGIPYEAIKKLRTKVNDALADPDLIGTEKRKMYAELSEALTADMKDAATRHGGLKEFEAANRYNHLGRQRIDDFFEGINKKVTPEDVYKIAIGDSPESATKLFKIKNSLRPEEWSVVRQTVLNRMGVAKSGVKTEDFEFSAETFFTKYNDLSKNPRVLDALFGTTKSPYRQNLDTIARTASSLRESTKVLANPSGTAGLGLQSSVLFAALGGAGNMLLGSALGITAGGIAPGAVVGITAGYAGSTGLAKLFTNERFVHWLAQGTKIPMKSLPGHISRLTVLSQTNPDIAPAVEEYANNLREQITALSPQR